MSSQHFLVFDVETLGEKPPAAIIELGWTSVELLLPEAEGENLSVVFGEMEGNALFGIPEGQVMTADNRAVHHIHPHLLRDEPLFDVAEWGGAALNDTEYLVAHNADFEKQWLEPLGLPWICTYKCALRAWPEAPSHSNQALKYWLDHEDSPAYYPPHRALPDAKVTAQTLWRLLLIHPVETLLQWSSEPRLVTRLPFGKHKGTLIRDAPGDYLDWVAGPKCEAADADLKHSCSVELEKRRMARSPFNSLTPGDRTDD